MPWFEIPNGVSNPNTNIPLESTITGNSLEREREREKRTDSRIWRKRQSCWSRWRSVRRPKPRWRLWLPLVCDPTTTTTTTTRQLQQQQPPPSTENCASSLRYVSPTPRSFFLVFNSDIYTRLVQSSQYHI